MGPFTRLEFEREREARTAKVCVARMIQHCGQTDRAIQTPRCFHLLAEAASINIKLVSGDHCVNAFINGPEILP